MTTLYLLKDDGLLTEARCDDTGKLLTYDASIAGTVEVRRIASGSKAINAGAGNAKYLHLDSGTNSFEILGLIINGVVGFDWTLNIYIPTADGVAAPAVADKRATIPYGSGDTEGGYLHDISGIPYNIFLDFISDSGTQTINDIVCLYRSAAVITALWET